MGGKNKTKSSSTQTNSLNSWSQGQYNNLSGNVQGILADNPFQNYGGQMSAGLSSQEQGAMDMFGGQMGQSNEMLMGAMGTAGQAYQNGPQSMEARSYADFDADTYMNPYTQNVIDNNMNDMNRSRQMAIADGEAGVHSSAFGGARHGVSDSLTNERFIDQASSMSANLHNQGYNQALGLYGADMDRGAQADMFNAGQQNIYDQGLLGQASLQAQMAGQYGQQNMNEAGFMSSLGANARGVEQGDLDRQYQEFLRAQQDPYIRAQMQMGLLGATPMLTNSTGTGSQTESTRMGIGEIAGMGLQAAMLSDKRLKTDIKPLGKRGQHNWYSYRYNWDEPDMVREGVMAQEVAKIQPEAVSEISGYMAVNYEVLN